MKILLCALTFFSAAAYAQNEAIQTKFSWPLKGKVSVKERTIKNGNRAVTAYNLNFKQDGERLHIQYSHFHFLTLNGIPAGDPRLTAVKKVEKLTANGLPEFVVSNDGHFVDLGNLDSLAAVMVPVAKDKESVKKFLANPQARRAIAAKAGELWFYWVDFWSAVSVENGKALVNVPTGFILFDSYNPATSKVEFLGKCSKSPTCIEMSLHMSMSGSEGAQLIQKSGKGVSPESAALQKFVKVKIDSSTLKPYEVLTRTTSKIVQGGKATDGTEEHEYFFDWPI